MSGNKRGPVIEEDLDDLDDVLNEFQATAAPIPVTSPPNKPAPSPPVATTGIDSNNEEDFPDPDDESLLDDPEFTKGLQETMAAMLGGEGGGGADFEAMMNAMMQGGGGGGEEGGFDPAAMMAALGGDMSAFRAAEASTSKAKDKGPAVPTPTGNFQDTIASALNKLKDSSTTVDAETEQKAASNQDPLAAMMAQMAGLGDLGGEEGLAGMLDEVMAQLMSRELLYEPLKELAEKYPAYLATNAATLSPADRQRFEEQQTIVQSIVAKFEEPGADVESGGGEAEEAIRRERNSAVVFLVGKMNDCGAPPPELMGAMPPGMELGPDGTPKLPEECIIC